MGEKGRREKLGKREKGWCPTRGVRTAGDVRHPRIEEPPKSRHSSNQAATPPSFLSGRYPRLEQEAACTIHELLELLRKLLVTDNYQNYRPPTTCPMKNTIGDV